LKDERKQERKHINDTLLPRLKYLEAFNKKLQSEKAKLQKIHEDKSMSIQLLGKVEPSMETDIGSFAEMIRDGYQA
jgi:hypothetical protein